MFVILTDPTTGKRLGKAGLQQHAAALTGRGPFRISTRLGIPGLRSTGRPYANDTREQFGKVKDFVGNTGFSAKVETTQREANALSGTYVMSNGGTYRLAVSEDRSRVVTLYGHGK